MFHIMRPYTHTRNISIYAICANTSAAFALKCLKLVWQAYKVWSKAGVTYICTAELMEMVKTTIEDNLTTSIKLHYTCEKQCILFYFHHITFSPTILFSLEIAMRVDFNDTIGKSRILIKQFKRIEC